MSQHIALDEKTIYGLIEYAPDNIEGDLAFPCFQLAKELKKAPPVIASELTEKLNQSPKTKNQMPQNPFSFIAIGPYLNALINTTLLTDRLITEINQNTATYGRRPSNHETVLIESPGPNTNKPLHLGHVRNMLLGNALANILEYGWFQVKKVDIINDRGIHICKSMLAYSKRGNHEQPTKKPDHYIGDRYIRYATELESDPTLEDQAQEMLRKREAGDPEIQKLRQTMRTRCLEGMRQTYHRYGTHIDRAYAESDHYQTGAELIRNEYKRWTFIKDKKGNVIYDFGDDSYGKKVLLRHDGTSIYITQDIALGKIRHEDYMMNRMIYVVGNEQDYHFKVLFELFHILGYDFADKCHHLSYGMIELPDGKMKSREGNVVDADTLADELHHEACILIEKRYPDRSENDKETQAEAIAIAAIKFYILLHDAKNNFIFDPKASISFDGETGPYIQYTYARCNSLLKKAQKLSLPITDFTSKDYRLQTTDQLHSLLVTLARFPEIQFKAVADYAPHYIARYLLDLAKSFNSLYHHQEIIDEDDRQQTANMIAIVHATQHVIGIWLQLLGIQRLEKM